MNARIPSRIAEDITEAATEISKQYQTEAANMPPRFELALSRVLDHMPAAGHVSMREFADCFDAAADGLESDATRLRQMAEGLRTASFVLCRGVEG